MLKKDKIYYREPVFRPPSEAYSLLIQLTEGCSYKCDFCGVSLLKKFIIREVDEVKRDLDIARKQYGPNVSKIFFLDGNAMVTPTVKLIEVIWWIFLFTPIGVIPNLREKRSRWQTCVTIYSM